MEDAQLTFQQCMEEHGIEGGGFSISVGDGPALDVDEQRPTTRRRRLPPTVDPEEFQAAAEECQSVYDDYPELDDVLPDGGPMGGVSVAHADEHTVDREAQTSGRRRCRRGGRGRRRGDRRRARRQSTGERRIGFG